MSETHFLATSRYIWDPVTVKTEDGREFSYPDDLPNGYWPTPDKDVWYEFQLYKFKDELPEYWSECFVGSYDMSAGDLQDMYKHWLDRSLIFIRYLLKKYPDLVMIYAIVWDDTEMKDPMEVEEFDITDLHLNDERAPDKIEFEEGVFYRFVMR